MEINEEILIEFKAGKKPAFDFIYKVLAPKMFTVCLRYTRCKDDAQDVLQESFIKVYTQRERFFENISFYAWVKSIVINTAITYIKQNYRLILEDNEMKFDQAVLSQENEDYPQEELKIKLLQILNQLPDGYRTVFNLFTIDNLTHKEIANYLGISESTSKTQFFKAKKMIQMILEKDKMIA